ncbi:MAG: competence protein ComEA [Sphingobacteriales bacterium]|jgi:competence protein ComEA
MINFIKSYFRCTKREARGNLVAFLFLLLTVGYTWYKRATYVSPFAADKDLLVLVDSLGNLENDRNMESLLSGNISKRKGVVLKPFNPNTAPKEELATLGFNKKQIGQIEAYRKAGGKFYKAQDLSKIYSINDSQYRDWEPFITIPKPQKEYLSNGSSWEKGIVKTNVPKKDQKPIDINLADSLELIELPGIGPFYASRILKFRNKLGGFYSKDQLDEVYGIKPDVSQNLKKIVTINGIVKSIKINQSDYDGLKGHPYIDGKMAGRILRHIKHNGPLVESDFLAMAGMDSAKVQKVLPYLSWEVAQIVP